MSLDVLLVRPPYPLSEYDQVPQEPVGIGYLTAVLRGAGLEVACVDAELQDLSVDEVLDRVEDLEPSVVGLSVMSRGSLPSALALARGVKDWAAPRAHVTVGGMMPSLEPECVLRLAGGAVDTVVRGEGEDPVVGIAREVFSGGDGREAAGTCHLGSGGLVRNPRKPSLPLAQLPKPDRDLLKAALDAGRACSVSTSRGCVGRCGFCAMPGFYAECGRSGWEGRPATDVLDEFEELRSAGVRDLNVVDEDFIGNAGGGAERAEAIAAGIADRGLDLWWEFETRPENVDGRLMADLGAAGLKSVFIGVESGDGRSRSLLGKPLSDRTIEKAMETLAGSGLTWRIGHVMFHPWSDLESVEGSLRFLVRWGQADPHALVNSLHLESGVPLFDRACAEDLLTGDALTGYGWRFTDGRVQALHAIALVAVRPLFPHWYGLVQERARILTELHSSGAATDPGTASVESEISRTRDLAAEVFEEALAIARQSPTDPLAEAIRLRDAALSRLAIPSEPATR